MNDRPKGNFISEDMTTLLIENLLYEKFCILNLITF